MTTEKHELRAAIFSAACLCMVCAAAGEFAFPGAVGFGVQTPGGHDGSIIKVTNLNSDGPGSLRTALAVKGRRIVVFEVGGIIDLNSTVLVISEPFITITGQTAPSPGISIIRGGIIIQDTHDVVIRHIRIRTGDAGHPKRSGFEPDGLATDNAYNIVVDQCSFAWAVDENLSASGPRHDGPEKTSRNVTFSNCIIAEGLDDSSHAKGRHSKGSLIHDYCTNIAVIGNLYAHNVDRNPYFKAFTTGVVVNNLIYNPGRTAIKVNWPQGEWRDQPVKPANARIAVVGNVMIAGADTKDNLALVASKGDVYMADNIAYKADGKQGPLKSGAVNLLEEKPVWPDNLKPLPADKVIEHVLTNAGARPTDRDEVDRRIIRQFKQRKGRIIDSQEQVGGYPKPILTRRKLDISRWRCRKLAGQTHFGSRMQEVVLHFRQVQFLN
jgi:pectate lyase